MLAIVKKFLTKTHKAFEKLGYYCQSSHIDVGEMLKKASRAINYAKEFKDAIETTRMLQFIIWHKKAISKLISKNLNEWKAIEYHIKEPLHPDDQIAVDECFYLTNALKRNGTTIHFSGLSLGDTFDHLKEKAGRYYVDCYYIRTSRIILSDMILCNKKDEKLAIIALDKTGQIRLKKNRTPYEITTGDNYLYIYLKDYINSLQGDTPDKNQMLASIQWDVLDEKSEYGLIKLTSYKKDNDMNMFFLFAAAQLITFNNHIKSLHRERIAVMNAGVIAGSAWVKN